MIIDILEPVITQVCHNNHGTRAVQTLIEVIKTDGDRVKIILKALKPRIIETVLDVHGNHVVQSCLLQFDPIYNELIFHEIKS